MSSHAEAPRVPCLDGLRTLAVLLVVLFHQEVLPFGWVGVQIFFVLSGYLITRLLVRASDVPLGEYLRDFYGRRSLRIFPLYFAVVGALALAVWGLHARLVGVAEGLPFAATYTYNIWHATSHFVHSKVITHFWSLCVEEQFYLVWPFLIYFCPRAKLGTTLKTIVLLGPFVRGATWWLLSRPGLAVHQPDVAVYVLTPSHVDAFAIGGYFALFPLGGSRRALFASFATLLAAGVLIVLFSDASGWSYAATWSSLGFPLGMGPGYALIWGFSLMNVCSALLIDCIAHRKFAPWFFEFPVLNYLGKISYGLYVFHYPLQSAVSKLLPNAGLLPQLALQLALTVAIASASFHLWESRFSRMKDVWFPGTPRAPKPSPALAGAAAEAGARDVR
jgi:peptidoglycan/LPS O-acetylase OafA/YrhL